MCIVMITKNICLLKIQPLRLYLLHHTITADFNDANIKMTGLCNISIKSVQNCLHD